MTDDADIIIPLEKALTGLKISESDSESFTENESNAYSPGESSEGTKGSKSDGVDREAEYEEMYRKQNDEVHIVSIQTDNRCIEGCENARSTSLHIRFSIG